MEEFVQEAQNILVILTPLLVSIFAVLGIIFSGIQKLQNTRLQDSLAKEQTNSELKYQDSVNRLNAENQRLVNQIHDMEMDFAKTVESMRIEMQSLSNAVTASQKEFVETNSAQLQAQLDQIKADSKAHYDDQKELEKKNAQLEMIKKQLDDINQAM